MKKRLNKYPEWPLYLWSMFFILFPFYVFGSGLPQPADWLLAILFIYTLIKPVKIKGLDFRDLIKKHYAFVVYVVVINTIWAFVIDQNYEKRFPSYFHSLFYIFNFLALKTGITLYQQFGSRLLKYTAYAVGISMVIQVFLTQFMSISARSALFFNNPNQLGYYALISGSILIYSVRRIKIGAILQLAFYFAFFYLTLVSASKAALAGSLILITLAVINQGLINIKQMLILGVAIVIGYYFSVKSEFGAGLFKYSIERFDTIGESKDDSYEGRGYDRIVNDPEYMIIGAGEGGYYRFDSALDAGEIHSTFGTIIFCYGIIGTVLFFRFLFAIFNRSSFFELLYFLPIFAYSITHQGLRVTLFWVFLGIIFILNWQKSIAKKRLRVKKKTPPNNYRTNIPQYSS